MSGPGSNLKEVGGSSIFELPQYQRDYSWTTTEVEELLDDLDYVLESNSKHYLGTIVVYEDDEVYKLVDGQQRITSLMFLFSSIHDRCEELKSHVGQKGSGKLNVIQNKCEQFFMDYDGEKNLTYIPDSDQIDVYLDLMDGKDLNMDNYSDPSHIALINSKKEIDDWVENKFNFEGEGGIQKQENILEARLNTVRRRVELTVYKVEDKLQANRMFEVINDRGKAVNEAEKIKSYLTYILSINEETALIDEVDDTFSQLYKEVSEGLSGSNKDIDKFILEHWRLFSGEPSDSQVHDDIKDHIDRDTSNERVKKWINAYIDSLSETMGYFKYLKHDIEDNLLKETRDPAVVDNKRSIYVIREYGPVDTVLPYMLSLLSNYGPDSDEHTKEEITKIQNEINKAIQQVESLVVVSYEFLDHNNDYQRSLMRKHSADIEWSRQGHQLEDVFSTEQTTEHQSIESDLLDSVKSSRKNLWKEIKDNDGENLSEELLSINDVLNGDAGSSGVDKDLIKYILLSYEDDKFHQSLGSIAVEDFHEDKSELYTLEHIIPRKLDDSLNYSDYGFSGEEEHTVLMNNLGNLGIIQGSLNSSMKNSPFDEKKSEYQKEKTTNMLNNISNKQKWTEAEITNRQSTIVDYIIDKWW